MQTTDRRGFLRNAAVAGAGASGDDLAFLRLLLRAIRNDDAALGLLFAVDTLDDDAIVQGTKLHGLSFPKIPSASLADGYGWRRVSTR